MNRLQAPLLLLCIFAMFSANAQNEPKLINSGKILKEGIQLHEDGKYLDAVKQYEQISRNDTNYTTAQYEEAYSLYMLGKYDTVMRMCRALIELNDYTSTDAYTLLGNTLDDKKMRPEAIKLYQEAIAKFPKAYMLHFNLGVAYFRANRLDDAAASFRKALEINPFHPTSHYFLGLINAELKRWTPALLAMNTCMILGPNKNLE